ncbi:MAG: 3'(2'),5'-bisphosphate nucleotidase, partial [Candidatus Eremiobacteraeota bacterium]|nr:3'(2'),5'-bisphosphate nucleotidase [Candidatus Eremiobacteraeota bacterium]
MFDSRMAEAAVTAVAEAIKVVGRVSRPQSLTKADTSPVTLADYASQAVVTRSLRDQLGPQTRLVGEEGSELLEKNPEFAARLAELLGFSPTPDLFQPSSIEDGACWVLDPIDGTKGFLRGDQYAIALALLKQHQIKVAVLGCPNLRLECLGRQGCLVVAVRGQGCWARPLEADEWLQLKTSDRQKDLRILTSVEPAHSDDAVAQRVTERFGATAIPMDSQAKYAVLAAGEGEVYLRIPYREKIHREYIWDQAAGSLIVEEAGGVITDLEDRPLDFSTGTRLLNNLGVCASNGPCHQALM